jgi:hypothetical protein
MVAKIVNLNKFRKTHNRMLKKRQANLNRVKFGQTKMEKVHNYYKIQSEYKKLLGKQLDDDCPDLA